MSKQKAKSMSSEKRSERRLGFILVAPSIFLILAIAIWPVFQSFYFSLFDYRLNDPAKSQVSLNYTLNVEKYANDYPALARFLKSSEMKAEDSQTKETLQSIRTDLQEVNEAIETDASTKEKIEEINEVLDAFGTPSDDVRFAQLSEEEAAQYLAAFDKAATELAELRDAKAFPDADKVAGLANSLEYSIAKPNFIGIAHYQDLLSDSRIWKALGNTATFTVASVAAELILGLAIALLINKAFFGRGLVRATILVPWAIPTAVSALMWKFLYDGQNGIIAKYFADIGIIDNMSQLLTTPEGAMFATIFSDVWKTTPYMALLLLAGLQTIPDSLYEAASIDGATKWKQFTTITLPLLKPSLLVALLFRTLDAFRVFDLIFVLTGGGPANSTETISIMAYKVMFSQTNFGAGSALSVIVFICVAIISVIYIRFLGADLISDGKK